jgi:peptidyl-prolyl cis-trans isomerase A (cyclophilin A)
MVHTVAGGSFAESLSPMTLRISHWSCTGLAMVVLLAGCSKPQEKDAPVLTAPSGQTGSAVPVGDVVQVKFATTKGDFVVEVHPEWAPLGAERFLDLVRNGFYDDCKFFRVVPGFVVQWGINGDPEVQAKWRDATIQDEPVVQSNTRGMMTFAKGGPDSRTSQVFISFDDNSRLDGMGFPAFAKVVSGMDVVEQINAEYGESPDQQSIQYEGNKYLEARFPRLDGIVKATILKTELDKGPGVDDEPKAPEAK